MSSIHESLSILSYVCKRFERYMDYIWKHDVWFLLTTRIPKDLFITHLEKDILKVRLNAVGEADSFVSKGLRLEKKVPKCVNNLKKLIEQYEKYNLSELNLKLEELKPKLFQELWLLSKYISNYIKGIEGDNNLEIYLKFLYCNLFLGDLLVVIENYLGSGGLFLCDGTCLQKEYIQCLKVLDDDIFKWKLNTINELKGIYNPIIAKRGKWNKIDTYFHVSDAIISKDRPISNLIQRSQEDMHLSIAVFNSSVLHSYLRTDPDLSGLSIVYGSRIYPSRYELMCKVACKVRYFDMIRFERLHFYLKGIFDKFKKASEMLPDQNQKYVTDFKRAWENYLLLYKARDTNFEEDVILSACYKIIRLYNAITNEIGINYINEFIWTKDDLAHTQPWEILPYVEIPPEFCYEVPPSVFENTNTIEVKNLDNKIKGSQSNPKIPLWVRKYFEFDIINSYPP